MSTATRALWLRLMMGTRAALGMIAMACGMVSACAVQPSPETLSCTTKFDCASTEVCDDGVCVPESTSPAKREDAGAHYPRPDAGMRDTGPEVLDSGQQDSATPDAGAADANVDAGLVDSGAFDAGCLAPISVDGFAGYCTIGTAVAAANNGSTILVPAGTYPESVDIAKTVTLRGIGAVTIAGNAGVTPLRLRANGIAIDNITIAATQSIGVEIAGSSILTGVIVNGAAGIGITVSLSGTEVTISGCAINAVADADPIWGEGIEFNDGTIGTIVNTTVTDASYLGILNLGGQVTIQSSRVERAGHGRCDNGGEYCGYGVVTDNGTTVIEQNSVINEAASAGALVYQSQFSISNSSITSSGHRDDVWSPGILIDGGDPVDINNNDISYNQNEGVGCWSLTDEANSCSNNTHTNNETWTNCRGC